MNIKRKKILIRDIIVIFIVFFFNFIIPIQLLPSTDRKSGIDINAIDFSPDGKIIASISIHGNICMHDVTNGDKIKQYNVKDKYALSLSFSPDGKLLASGYNDGNIYLWNINTGKKVKEINETSLPINSVCFSPNGKFITSVSNSHLIRLWEITTGKEKKVFKKINNYIGSIAFSNDNNIIAAGYNDGTIGLWDVNSGNEINQLYGHKGVVYAVCFNDDNQTIASGSWDGTIRLWDVKSGKEIKAMNDNSGRVYSINFIPNGKTIVSGSEDGFVHLWDVELGKKILSMKHTGRLYSVKFNPNGKILASASSDGTIRIWDFVSGKEILRIEGSETENIKFKTEKKNVKLVIMTKPKFLQTVDGEITNFSIKVKNSGTGNLYLVRIIEDIDLNQKTPLIFHPSTLLEKLAANEIAEIPCKVSALSGYNNPVDQTSILHLKISSANSSSIPINIPVKINVPFWKFKIINAKLKKDYIKDTLVILLQYLGEQDLLNETEFNVQIGDYNLYEIKKSNIKVADKIELYYTVPEDLSLNGKPQIILLIKKMEHPVHVWKFPITSIDYPRAKWHRNILLLIFVLTILAYIYIRFYRNRFKKNQH